MHDFQQSRVLGRGVGGKFGKSTVIYLSMIGPQYLCVQECELLCSYYVIYCKTCSNFTEGFFKFYFQITNRKVQKSFNVGILRGCG